MAKTSFREMLAKRCDAVQSRVCVGLDPALEKLPEHVRKMDDPLTYFVEQIVHATKDSAAVYKPNFAFFEAFGMYGREVLAKVRSIIPADIPIILDAKVADIGNTSAMYAKAFFEELGFDALTVNPYLGSDSVAPFLAYPDKGIFLLCLTSNQGSADLQKQQDVTGAPIFMRVAELIKKWDNDTGNCGAVVGATHPDVMRQVRTVLDKQPLLIPGVGAQGGDLEAVCTQMITEKKLPAVINASRSILYASSGEDFAEAAGLAAAELRSAINNYLG